VSAPRGTARAAAAPLAAAVVLALAACGDDGADRLSRDEYVRAADAICTEYEDRLARLENPRNLAGLARLADEALPIAREGVRRLRALRPPDELARRVRAWLERNDRNLRTIEQLRAAARAGDETRVQELASAGADNEAAADRLARELGLAACAAPD
jgi:hypothetical protein